MKTTLVIRDSLVVAGAWDAGAAGDLAAGGADRERGRREPDASHPGLHGAAGQPVDGDAARGQEDRVVAQGAGLRAAGLDAAAAALPRHAQPPAALHAGQLLPSR